VVIDLDPGMAFGTGQHATTRMCLELLEEYVQPGDRVLDVGTGSGILAVAAAKLGARECLALDIEPRSAAVARENAARNGVNVVIRTASGSLGDGWPLPEPSPSNYDLGLANITAAAVAELMPSFAAALRPGGQLIASGIIGERMDAVRAAMAAAGFDIVEERAEGDWRAVVARRRA
jgi:ribosomal protein L11 methyltransferase